MKNEKLKELSEAFNLKKTQILKQLAFNCRNIKKLKQKDYNLVFAQLLFLNKNISELLEIVKSQKNIENKEILEKLTEILTETKIKIKELQQKV